MLQKEFFQVQPFNPNPYWNPVIVNLSGAQKFEENTVFAPGRYSVIVMAGGNNHIHTNNTGVSSYGVPAKIQKDIIIREPFIIRAYCGSSASGNIGGLNLYSGPFKVNPRAGDAPNVNHIFGTCGASDSLGGTSAGFYGSGNCLGDGFGFTWNGDDFSCGAGSCLHLLPAGGEFGTDYLFAFHATAGTDGQGATVSGGTIYGGNNGGGGSAYGGSASGNFVGFDEGYGFSGGNTPYGNGGARTYGNFVFGNNGTGVGHGWACSYSNNVAINRGAGAFFNGTTWEQIDSWGNWNDQGVITITYLGTI